MIAPSPRSKTRRRSAATHARTALQRYSTYLGRDDADEAVEARITALLWAQAHIEQALAEETRGAWGSESATPRRVAKAYAEQVARS